MILKALGREAKTPKGRRPVRDQRGTISMGHPIGASGARVALHLPLELGRRGGGLGAAGLCGGGQGEARLGCAAAAARARRRSCASAADEPYRVEPEK